MTKYNTEVKGKEIWGASGRAQWPVQVGGLVQGTETESDTAPRRPGQTQEFNLCLSHLGSTSSLYEIYVANGQKMVKKIQCCRSGKTHHFCATAVVGSMTKLSHGQWCGGFMLFFFLSLFLRSFFKDFFSPYEFKGRCGVQHRAAWVTGDTCCEIIFACGLCGNSFLLHLLQDDIWINSWLDSSGQIKRLGVSGLHFPRALFHNRAGYNSSPRVPARSSAPPLEHLISIWLSCSVFTCLSIIAGSVMLLNANCLTGFPLHSAFTDLFSHRTASDAVPLHVLWEETDTSCCTHQLHNCWKNEGCGQAKKA